MFFRRVALVALLSAGLVTAMASSAIGGTDEDEEIAQASILTEDDVAEFGLEEVDPRTDELPPIPECKKLRALDKASDRLGSATSQFFSEQTGAGADNEVTVFKSAAKARAAVAAFTSDDGAACRAADVDNTLESRFGEYELEGESFDPELGDNSVIYGLVATVTDEDGRTSDIFLEIGLVRVGRALIQLQFQGVNAEFEGSGALANLVVDNVTANLEG